MARQGPRPAADPPALDAVHRGDCLEILARVPEASVHLAFADPPFNIGYEYDVYQDKKKAADYLQWTEQWLAAADRVLKPNGISEASLRSSL